MAYQKYVITTKRFSVSGDVPRSRNINGFTVTNIGDTAFKINDKILYPSATPATDQGDSVSYGGNEGEIYAGNMDLQFLVPLGAAPLCEIIFKYYVDITPEYRAVVAQ